MIDQAGASVRPPGDFLKLWGAGLVVVGTVFFVLLFLSRFGLNLARESLDFFTWVIAAGAVGAYLLICAFLGRRRADELVTKVTDKVLGLFDRVK